MYLKIFLSFVISLVLSIVLYPKLIEYLKKMSFNQSVSQYSLQEYKKQAPTPVMGGVLFILVPILMTFLLDFHGAVQSDLLVVMVTFAGYGAIGFIDDFLIVVKKNNDGLKPWQKFLLQAILAVVFYLAYQSHATLDVHVPFTKVVWHLGSFYGLLVFFMFTGSSNAVNLTDGMDGLSAGCTQFSLLAFLVIAIVQQKITLCIFIASLMGCLFGYLRYNVEPAKIFMGDTGALALGAVLAAIAMTLKTELALIVIGGVFVIETICVIIQQVSVRTGHGKVFVYTPIHYAFVIKGMGKKQTVRMFYLASAIFCVLGIWVGLH